MRRGFTLLEVMVALALVALALVAVFRSQSRSLSLGSEAGTMTICAALAQARMARTETMESNALVSGSGSFEGDFRDYAWEASTSAPPAQLPGVIARHLKRIDLRVYSEAREEASCRLRLYRFVPETP